MIPEFTRNVADRDSFNQSCNLPYELRITSFKSAMQEVYDFFHDVNSPEPVRDRSPMTFTEVYLAQVTTADFRRNPRGELGTRTATLDRQGVAKLRESWLYRL